MKEKEYVLKLYDNNSELTKKRLFLEVLLDVRDCLSSINMSLWNISSDIKQKGVEFDA